MNTSSEILKFRDPINISVISDSEIIVQDEIFSLKIQNSSKAIRLFLEALKNTGGTEDELSDMVQAGGSGSDLMNFYYYIEKFLKLCMVSKTLCYNGLKFAEIEPIAFGYKWAGTKKIDKNQKYIISRFAFTRRHGLKHICESPLSLSRLVLHDEYSAALMHFMSSPADLNAIKEKFRHLGAEFIEYFLESLLNSGFIVTAETGGKSGEDDNEALLQWDFHDLLFHSRTRIGRHNYPNGATYPYLNKIAPLQAYKEPMTKNGIELFKPDIEALKQEDFPFTLVLEQRQSIRSYADTPLDSKQLGEFLYRSFRIKEIIEAPPGEAEAYQVGRRTYAGGGAGYELEIYPVINKCSGLERGIYHYDPLNHKLHLLNIDTFFVETLIQRASMSAAKLCMPEVLFCITARFARMSWKYSGMAYAAILKNVGSLYQNMYLVATAMDLAPCALGNGESDVLCKAAGLDYISESAVGEFILGRKRI